jgi:hypothetical protein
METGHEQQGPALRSESPRREHDRRRRQIAGLAAGALAGLVAGILIEYVFGSERLTGHADDPFSIAFGLPVAMAIAVGLFGLLLGTAKEAPVQDAPVRERRFQRMGRAAVSKQGQLPGSPVPPAYDEDDGRNTGV